MASEKLSAEAATKLERRRLRAEAFALRAQRMSERAAAERSRHSSLDAVFDLVDRDVEVGGGIIAGALLLGLFVVGRVMVVTAELNATLVERRRVE
jgi:hypothetical protein